MFLWNNLFIYSTLFHSPLKLSMCPGTGLVTQYKMMKITQALFLASSNSQSSRQNICVNIYEEFLFCLVNEFGNLIRSPMSQKSLIDFHYTQEKILNLLHDLSLPVSVFIFHGHSLTYLFSRTHKICCYLRIFAFTAVLIYSIHLKLITRQISSCFQLSAQISPPQMVHTCPLFPNLSLSTQLSKFYITIT